MQQKDPEFISGHKVTTPSYKTYIKTDLVLYLYKDPFVVCLFSEFVGRLSSQDSFCALDHPKDMQ